MRKTLTGELLAELLGTMILILFGLGVVAQVVTAGFPESTAGGDHDSIAWAWGIGVTMGVYVAGRLSGAHLNPAVTVALAAYKGFAWRKVVPYSLAQLTGAFVGAMIVRLVYADQIANVDPGHTSLTQGIFSTSPGAGVSIGTAFLDQVVGTAILVMLVFALTSAINNPPLANLGPLLIGLVVVAIGMAWGTNAGYAINPARDLGPRLASLLTGYEHAMFATGGGQLYFWLPVLAPVVGALLGGAVFVFGIERHLHLLPAEPAEPADAAAAAGTDLRDDSLVG